MKAISLSWLFTIFGKNNKKMSQDNEEKYFIFYGKLNQFKNTKEGTAKLFHTLNINEL